MNSSSHPHTRQPRQRRGLRSAHNPASGREPQSASFTATEAKNEFGYLLEKAIQGTTVVITKHDRAKAVLISIDQFNALKHAPQSELKALSHQFDALLEHMQSEKARSRMKSAFHASTEQLGKAALVAARKRGQ